MKNQRETPAFGQVDLPYLGVSLQEILMSGHLSHSQNKSKKSKFYK